MTRNRPADGSEWMRLGQQLADEIRARRRAAGLSQSALAARIGYTPQYVRKELAATTAELADLASWATFDAGYHEPAQRVSLHGLRAARESGDLGIRAWVASGLARQEIQLGHWVSGLELVQLALTGGDALNPNAVADLHIVRARAYARQPDTAACLRYIGAAADTYRPELASAVRPGFATSPGPSLREISPTPATTCCSPIPRSAQPSVWP